MENRVVMRGLRKIKKGEEITINYYDLADTFAQFSKKSFRFTCNCLDCLEPEQKVGLNDFFLFFLIR